MYDICSIKVYYIHAVKYVTNMNYVRNCNKKYYKDYNSYGCYSYILMIMIRLKSKNAELWLGINK